MSLFDQRSFELDMLWSYFKKHWLIYSLLLAYAILLLSKAFGFNTWLPECLITKITGHNCYGCGLNTAATLLFRLEFRNAFEANPLIFLYVPGIIVWVSVDFIKFKGKHNQNQNDKN